MNRSKILKKDTILLTVLVFFHLVGLCSLFSKNLREIVLPLSAYNLLLSFIILLIAYKKQFQKVLFLATICFVAGMIFELIGIGTGYLFGNYSYNANLGIVFLEVPLIIGINWGLLVISSASVSSLLFKNIYLKTIFASILMTLLDVLIEPVAVASNYWLWENNHIPFTNYLCWFLLSLPLNFLFYKFKINEQNRVAIGLYFIFVCFFSILNFY